MKLTQKIAVRYIRARFKVLAALSKKKAATKAFALFCTPMSRNKRELPPVFLQAEKLSFQFQSNLIAGYRWNKGGTRKALVLHGFESSVINFDKYVKGLIQKNYEVLAFDAPAHGRSAGKQINALVYSEMIREIQNTYGPFQSYMAHSFGGLALTMALAETSPQPGTRIVLIAPATETSTAIDQFFHFLRINDPEMRHEFENIIQSFNGSPVSWYSIPRALKNIRAEILWLHDNGDPVTPVKDVLPVKEENHPNIRFVFTEGLGHSRIYRDAAVRKQVIDFL